MGAIYGIWSRTFRFILILPLILFLYEGALTALPGVYAEPLPYSYFIAAFAISAVYYALSFIFKDSLFVHDDMHVNTSLFLSCMLMMPFIYLYPRFATASSSQPFVFLQASVIIVSVALGLASFKMESLDIKSLETSKFMVVVLAILSLASFSIVFILSLISIMIGLALGYLSLCGFFAILIYMAQTLHHRKIALQKKAKNIQRNLH
jgi:hypothetical protein